MGGFRVLANLLFKARDINEEYYSYAGLAVRCLAAGFLALGDETSAHKILTHYSADDSLVPVIFGLLDRWNDDAVICSLKHEASLRLLLYCITLQTEVPLETWQRGYGIIIALVSKYFQNPPGVSPVVISSILTDVSRLLLGFVDHFDGAVTMIVRLVGHHKS